jgi:hypothetical protein
MQKAKKDLSNILGYLSEPIIKKSGNLKKVSTKSGKLLNFLHEKSFFASQKPEFHRLKFGENLPKI